MKTQCECGQSSDDLLTCEICGNKGCEECGGGVWSESDENDNGLYVCRKCIDSYMQSRRRAIIPVLSVTLPFDLTNGNEGRSKIWYKPFVMRQKYEQTIRALGHVRKPFNRRVRLVVTRVLGKGQRKFDPMSLGRGNWKEIEDALVACGWFYDDSCTWIDQSSGFRQDDTRRDEGPCVIVEVFDAVFIA